MFVAEIGVEVRQWRGAIADVERTTITAIPPIVGDVLDIDFPPTPGFEIAIFHAQHHPARSHPARGQGQITVRCDVPVIRNSQIQAGFAAVTLARKQEPRLPLLGDGKRQVRKVENRPVAKGQHQVTGRAAPGRMIQSHRARPQLPVFPAARARRIGGAFQPTALLAPVQPDLFRGTLGVTARQIVVHVPEPAGPGVQVHFRLLAAQDLPGVAIDELALGPGAVSRTIESDPVGAQPPITARQTDITLQQRSGG